MRRLLSSAVDARATQAPVPTAVFAPVDAGGRGSSTALGASGFGPSTRAGVAARAVRGPAVAATAALALLLFAPPALANMDGRAPPDHPFASSVDAAQAVDLLEEWDIEGAEKVARELATTAPDDPATHYVLGRVAFENGDYTKAAEEFELAFGARARDSHDWQLASGAEKEMRGTVSEESANFVFRYKPGPDAALVPYAMETLESALRALAADLDWKPARKIRVEFVTSPVALARLSSLTEEAIRTTGTVALCKYNRLIVTSPRALLRGYGWQDTLSHEFVHYVITRKSRNTVPIWLHEGLAKFLESRWRGPPGLAMDAGLEALLARALKKNNLVTFARMHPSIALLPSQEEAALAYAEVFTAVEFVHQRKGMAGLRAILDATRTGKSDREAVGGALGMTFEQFESKWKASLHERGGSSANPMIEKLVFRDDKQKKPKQPEKSWDRGSLGSLPQVEARKHAHLGELLRARGRGQAAVVEFEKAIAIAGPQHPVLARKYAMTVMALGRGADAEKVLRASLKQWPEEPGNQLLLGRILVDSGRAAEGRKYLLLANGHDPFDPEIHQSLHAAAKALNDAGSLAREEEVLKILAGQKTTWSAPQPGGTAAVANGFLRIESPSGARVFVDGVDTGLTTPVEEHPLPAGRHVVRIEPESGPAIERTLDIPADGLVPFDQS